METLERTIVSSTPYEAKEETVFETQKQFKMDRIDEYVIVD